MKLRNRLIRDGMQAVLGLSAFLARRPALEPLSRAWSRGLAALVVRSRRIHPQATPEQLGRAWQSAFASARQVPITHTDADTAYGEIHTPCPLRGSGDVHACHRMMEYDRAIAEKAGGQFVVLRSQAQAGVARCQIAIRRAGAATDDLVPAHRPARS